MRERIFQIVQRARPGDKLSHAYDIFIVSIAFLSIIPLMFRPHDMGSELTFIVNMLDVVTVCILFFDYIMRWATHDIKTGKKGWKEFAKYPFTPLAIIDLLAILPSLGVLPETFKFLRVLRVTKMFRYSKNLTIVESVFRSEKNTLLSVLAVTLMYIFVSGLIMFVNEPQIFNNFFDALYWATTTLTTIGYGDVVPGTDLGKLIAMVSSLFGIAIIALPAGIITGGFLEQIRRSQEHQDEHPGGIKRAPFTRRTLASYGSVRAYLEAHRKMFAYAATMAVCLLFNEVFYLITTTLGTPVWLDTVGTAVAAILLEPVAALIIAFVNSLIQAIQFGDAGNLLYYGQGVLAALVYGTLFARGKKITPKTVGWALIFVVGVGTLLSCALTFALRGGALSTPMQHMYYQLLGTLGLSGTPALVVTLLVDKFLDAIAVFVLVIVVSRGVMGSRIDPQRWFEDKKSTCSAAEQGERSEQGSADSAAAQGHPGKAASAQSSDQAPAQTTRYVLGLDVGGTHTKAGVFTLDGQLVGSHVFDTPRVLNDGSHAQLSVDIGTLLELTGVDAGTVAAVGLAVPGAVSDEELLRMCPNLDLDLRAYKSFLHSLFPNARIVALNDADAAMLGDYWCGSTQAREHDTIVFVTVGTGVGAGLIMKGEPFVGVHGAAGEVGHLCVDPNAEEVCSCGGTGCLEQYASATGLVRIARTAYGKGGDVAFPDARAVLEAATRRDPAARAALKQFSDALGFGLAQMACMLDPDVFVLGGGLSERADLFLDDVKARYRACALFTCKDTPIVASSLGNQCGTYGAAYRALQELEKQESPNTSESKF